MCGVGVAVPVLSVLSAETVGTSAIRVEGDVAGRLNLVRVVDAGVSGAAYLLQIMCLA